MSHEVACDVMNLRMRERPGHTIYTQHYELMERVSGLSREHPQRWRRFLDA